jgi:hypothetical protein
MIIAFEMFQPCVVAIELLIAPGLVFLVDDVCMDDTYLVIVLIRNLKLDTIICNIFQCNSCY